MKKRFSFLKNQRALAEIRKYRWVKSKELGQEVGFATAALDWIKQHGQSWKEFHIDSL